MLKRYRRPNPFLPLMKRPVLRRHVEEVCTRAGAKLTVSRLHVGSDRECRLYSAGDVVLSVVLKGCRPDWRAMRRGARLLKFDRSL